MRYLTSFNDQGFDAANLTYEPQQELNDGTTWYWRVRAISATNQLGNWSETNHFLLPDTTTWDLGNNKVAVELRHEQAMPSLGIVGFEDTTVIRGSSGQTYDTSSTLRVGDTSTQQAATLLRIPLTDIPNPQNARVEGAELHMFSQLSSAVGVNVGILPALVDWNASANETTYDGTNNWTGRQQHVHARLALQRRGPREPIWCTGDDLCNLGQRRLDDVGRGRFGPSRTGQR